MLGRFLSARRVSGRSVASALAVTAALAAAGASPAAYAQNQQRPAQAKASYSPNFVKAYQPIEAITKAQGGDFNAAKAQLPGLIAAAASADERFAAGNLALQVATKLNDRALQRQALELMVGSGKMDAAQIGQAQYYLGSLAYDANDYAAARTALEAARAAGYQDENLPALLAESYFKGNQAAQGLDYLKGVIAQRTGAGTAVPENWLLRGLKVAYENKLAPQANEWAALVAANAPSAGNWAAALQVVNAMNQFDPQARLDLLRLMAATNGMTTKREYVEYIETADPRVMSNEVAKVLQQGLAAGVFKASDPDYADFKRVADQRTASDRADAPKMVAEARSAANGNAAMNAGDVLYSLSQYAEAEQMYQLALTKGGVDKDKALTRLGIVQAQQGKKAEATATFAQVSGARAPIAKMWQAYVNRKA